MLAGPASWLDCTDYITLDAIHILKIDPDDVVFFMECIDQENEIQKTRKNYVYVQNAQLNWNVLDQFVMQNLILKFC